MGDLSIHFSEHEFRCQRVCCGGTSVTSTRLLRGLELFREMLQVPGTPEVSVIINSGFRCNKHNKRVNGSENSQHTKGRAADIKKIPGLTIDRMATLAQGVGVFNQGGIGKYDWGIHVDVRKTSPARWDRRT